MVVEMKRWFGDISMDVVFRIVAGKSFKEFGATEEKERYRKAVREFFKLSGVFTVGDAVPFLRFLDVGGYEKKMKEVGKELDVILSGWLTEHKEKTNEEEIKEQDFIDIMLSALDEKTVLSFDPDVINKSTCLTMTLGATDSTTVTLTRDLSLLLNNPSTLKKA